MQYLMPRLRPTHSNGCDLGATAAFLMQYVRYAEARSGASRSCGLTNQILLLDLVREYLRGDYKLTLTPGPLCLFTALLVLGDVGSLHLV